MKGTIFNKQGLELNLITQGERWFQGESIKGTILCRGLQNNTKSGEESCSAEQYLNLYLAHADFKDLPDSKNKNIFKIKDKQSWKISSDKPLEWNFKLPSDCAITDKTSSLFLLYGTENRSEHNQQNEQNEQNKQSDNNDQEIKNYGHLQLTILTHPVIECFLKTFELFLRFKIGAQKFKLNGSNGFVETKLTPPQTKEYGNVDSLLLQAQVNSNNELNLRYIFTVRSLKIVEGQAQVEKKKRNYDQILLPAQYDLFPGPKSGLGSGSGSPNHEEMQKKINEILEPIKTKVLF